MSISVGSCVVIRSGPFVDCGGIVVEVRDGLWLELAESRAIVCVEREQVAERDCGPLTERCVAARSMKLA
jgi:hypothetical protein